MLSQIIVKIGRNFSKQGGRGTKIAGTKKPAHWRAFLLLDINQS
ncbi:hypothetical protein 7AX3_76 [uncultured Caudovirales phage]|uniref:Uncharacterized protein n=1 Tax=uncultured Caudovirales phage TaxID=2100421 RepID=A0A2H4J941_9CAUD|nr:hypothetical protein 7AX3_76 [uncultured Caudovirales phage]